MQQKHLRYKYYQNNYYQILHDSHGSAVQYLSRPRSSHLPTISYNDSLALAHKHPKISKIYHSKMYGHGGEVSTCPHSITMSLCILLRLLVRLLFRFLSCVQQDATTVVQICCGELRWWYKYDVPYLRRMIRNDTNWYEYNQLNSNNIKYIHI